MVVAILQGGLLRDFTASPRRASTCRFTFHMPFALFILSAQYAEAVVVMDNSPSKLYSKTWGSVAFFCFLLHAKSTSPYPLGDQRDLTTVGFVELLMLISVTTCLTQCRQSLILWLVAAGIRQEDFFFGPCCSVCDSHCKRATCSGLSSLVFFCVATRNRWRLRFLPPSPK